MDMKKALVKGMVIGLVFIFIGGSIVPSISGIVTSTSNISIIISDDFDSKIESLMELGHFPSLVACIVKNNTLAWSKGYGYADISLLHKRKATNDTVFPMGSISKSIAATAIMQLNETGLISLDDNVSIYLPFDLKNPKYPDVNITARMLLAHQSSIKNMGLFISVYCQLVKDPLGWLERYFKKPNSWCDYAPGENVTYATIDINILGYVIENITDQQYADYCQYNIFNPLNMTNTSFYLSDFNKNQLTRQYVWFKGVYLRVPFIKVSEIMFPGGGLRSTITDMSHFLIMHTSGGIYNGIRILSEESVEEMHRAQYPETLDEGFYHGLGWYFKPFPDGETYGGHDGTHLGTYAVMTMRYSDKVGVMFFYNQHSYLLMLLKRVPPEEKEAVREIKKALFEKADEL
jgi:CubicO group peptidase (beta-lactamase class C family)